MAAGTDQPSEALELIGRALHLRLLRESEDILQNDCSRARCVNGRQHSGSHFKKPMLLWKAGGEPAHPHCARRLARKACNVEVLLGRTPEARVLVQQALVWLRCRPGGGKHVHVVVLGQVAAHGPEEETGFLGVTGVELHETDGQGLAKKL